MLKFNRICGSLSSSTSIFVTIFVRRKADVSLKNKMAIIDMANTLIIAPNVVACKTTNYIRRSFMIRSSLAYQSDEKSTAITYLGQIFRYTAIEVHRGHYLPPTMTTTTSIQIIRTRRSVHIGQSRGKRKETE
jgi:hypothetical protein